VKERQMSNEVDMKACTILERLSAEFSGGSVDYTCTQDLHEFHVTNAGLTHELGFDQRVLELEDIPDIEQVVARLADQLRASSGPRRIRVGAHEA
jgi:hypothetical protein